MSKRKIWSIALCVLAILCIIFIFSMLRDDDREAPRQIELMPAPLLTPEATAQSVRRGGEFEPPIQGTAGYATPVLQGYCTGTEKLTLIKVYSAAA